MNIPSIKLRYLEKLKLWHDYLSPNSIFETQKEEYWKHEKVFLLWAFTPLHRHLYTSIDNKRIFEFYDEKEFSKLKNYVNKDFSEKLDELKKDIDGTPGKINYVKGNLDVEGFVETTEINIKGYPEKIRILSKGLLLGEIIFEAYSKNNKWYQKDFLYYKCGLWSLKIIIVIAVLSLLMVFIGQIVNIFDDNLPKKIDINECDHYNHHHTFHNHL